MSAKKTPLNPQNQTTLFQNWGYYGRQAQQATGSGADPEEPILIEDDFEDIDDATLLAACEQAELTNQQPQNDCQPITEGVPEPEATPLEALPGFDVSAGRLWIYPTNYPVRDYQFNIVGQALKTNTLVTLPTGLGKTFIAAVVMYNYYRWYPQGKVVFMAPTKPLVAQQIEACFNIMGIPEADMAEMTGSMPPVERKKVWRAKRVFFLTPQVLTNDLSRQACPAVEVKCLVVDEAHKALGNHAYCEVVRELSKYTPEFRVLALSATPGGDLKAVQQVINNLLISHVEIRSEESIDIQPYAHERKVEKVVVPLGEELRHLQKQYLDMLRVYIKRLASAGAVFDKDPALFSKFQLLKAREAFRQDPPPQAQNKGAVEGDFAISLSLYHGYELLMQHGTRTLYNFLSNTVDGEKGFSRTRQELMRNGIFINMMNVLREKFDHGESGGNMSLLGSPSSTPRPVSCTQMSKKFVVSHPKMQRLQEVVIQHFRNYKNNFKPSLSTSEAESAVTNDDTRVMIFAQYRDSVQEIAEMLNCHQPLVRCMSFVGQSSAGKATKGISQKEQLRVVKEFRCGNYNTLVSTCVGEEGLDIGDVDLIVCYDAHKSPTRLVQRMGRTGRKRKGRIVMLMTEGKEASVYDKSQYSRRGIHKALQGNSKSLQLFPSSPRMIPRGLEPQPHKMHITSEQYVGKQKKSKGGKKTAVGTITRLLKNDKNAFLTEEEHMDYLANFQVDEPVPTLPPRGRFLSLGDSREVPEKLELSLSNWSLWQSKEQKTHLVGHSKRTGDFVQLMEFMEILEQTDGEDIYGREMARHLNERDVMIPESEKGIKKFCRKNNKGTEGRDSGGDRTEPEEEMATKKKERKKREPLPVLVSDDSEDDFLDKSGCTLPEVKINGETDTAEVPDKNESLSIVADTVQICQENITRGNKSNGGMEVPQAAADRDMTLPVIPVHSVRTGPNRVTVIKLNAQNETAQCPATEDQVGICGPRTEPRGIEERSQLPESRTEKEPDVTCLDHVCVTAQRAPADSCEFAGPEEPNPATAALTNVETSTGTDNIVNENNDGLLQNIESTASSETDDVNPKPKQKLKKKKKRRKELIDDAFEETSTTKESTSPLCHKPVTDSAEPPKTPRPRKPSEVTGKIDKSPKHINDLLKLLKSHRKDSKAVINNDVETLGDGSRNHVTKPSNEVETVKEGRDTDTEAGAEEDLSCLFPCSQFSFSLKPMIRGGFNGGHLPPSPPSVSSLDILDDIELSFGTPGRKVVSDVSTQSPTVKRNLVAEHHPIRLSPVNCPESEADRQIGALESAVTHQDGHLKEAVEPSQSSYLSSVDKSAANPPALSFMQSSSGKAEEDENHSCMKNSVLDNVRVPHKNIPAELNKLPVEGGNPPCRDIYTDAHTTHHKELGITGSRTNAGTDHADAAYTKNCTQIEGKMGESLCLEDLQGFDDWNDTNDVPDVFDVETPNSAKPDRSRTSQKLSVSKSFVQLGEDKTPTSAEPVRSKTSQKLSVSKSFVQLREDMSFNNTPGLKKSVLNNRLKGTLADTLSSDQIDSIKQIDLAKNVSNDEHLSDQVGCIPKGTMNRPEAGTETVPTRSENCHFQDGGFVLSDIRNTLRNKSDVVLNFELNFDLSCLDDDDNNVLDATNQGIMFNNMTKTSPLAGALDCLWVESPALNQLFHQPKAESTPLTHKRTFQIPTKLALTPVSAFRAKPRRESKIGSSGLPVSSVVTMNVAGEQMIRNNDRVQEEQTVIRDPSRPTETLDMCWSSKTGKESPQNSARGSLLEELSFSDVSEIPGGSKKRKDTASSPEIPGAKKRKSILRLSPVSSPVEMVKPRNLAASRDKESLVSFPQSVSSTSHIAAPKKVIESTCDVSGQGNSSNGFGHPSADECRDGQLNLPDADEKRDNTFNDTGLSSSTLRNMSQPKKKRMLQFVHSDQRSKVEAHEMRKNNVIYSPSAFPQQRGQKSRKSAELFESPRIDSEGQAVGDATNNVSSLADNIREPGGSRKLLQPEFPELLADEDVTAWSVNVGSEGIRPDPLISPERKRPKRKSQQLESSASNPGNNLEYVDSDDDAMGNGGTQEFDICLPNEPSPAKETASPIVVISDEEVLSQIPKAKKRCRNVLRSPEDDSPPSQSVMRMPKKRRSKRTLLQSSSEDEVTPVKPPSSRKKQSLISPPSMIPDLDSDFEDATPLKPRQLTRNSVFAKPASKITVHKAGTRKTLNVRRGVKDFLDEEAELSGEEGVSSDEEGSMLDHSLDGFINNATQLTQQSPSGVKDMHAVYIQSIRSPAGNAILHPGRNRFKMSHDPISNDNIFSQAPHPDESYTEDSFCVEGDDRSTSHLAEVTHGDLENTINVDNIIGGTGCKRLRSRGGGESKAARILRLGRKAVLKSDSTDEESGSDEGDRIQKRKSEKRAKGHIRAKGQQSSLKTISETTADLSSVGRRRVNNVKGHQLGASGKQFQKTGQPEMHFQSEGNLRGKSLGPCKKSQFQSKSVLPKGSQCKDEGRHPHEGLHPQYWQVKDGNSNDLPAGWRNNQPTHQVEVGSTDRGKSGQSKKCQAEENGSIGNNDVRTRVQRPQGQFGDIGLNFDLGFEEGSLSDAEEPVEEDPSRLFQSSLQERVTLTKEQLEREERLRKQKEKQEEFRKKMAAKRKAAEGGSGGPSQESQGFSVTSDRGGTLSDVSLTTRAVHSSQLPQDSQLEVKTPVILISSKVLSSSSSLVSTLAIKHSMDPRVCQLRGCDFMVSSRMGVERKTLSDFALSSNKTKFVERIKEMGVLFDKICVVIEKDRLKKEEKSKAFTRSKYFDSTLAALTRASVKILFSDSIDDTSMILADLAKVEARKGFCIKYPKELNEMQEQVQSFCQAIPGVSFALSLSMTLNFASLSQLITCTEKMLQQRTGISGERARCIVGHFRHQFDEQMMGTPKRR